MTAVALAGRLSNRPRKRSRNGRLSLRDMFVHFVPLPAGFLWTCH